MSGIGLDRESTQPGFGTARRVWLAALLLVATFCSFMPCLTPFSALAVALAATARLRSALAVMLGMWMINQAVGYGFLSYPRTWDSYAWGVVTLLAAAAAVVAAHGLLRRGRPASQGARVVLAYVLAHAVYELVLLAATPVLGGIEAFSPAIMTRIFLGNALWLACLIAFNELLSLALRPWLGRWPKIASAA